MKLNCIDLGLSACPVRILLEVDDACSNIGLRDDERATSNDLTFVDLLCSILDLLPDVLGQNIMGGELQIQR